MQEDLKLKNIWNYHPNLPIKNSPVFLWPPNPKEAFLHITKRWVTLTRFFAFVLLSIFIYKFLTPSFEVMKTFSVEWVSHLFLRNTLILAIIAGSIHLYLYTFNSQENNFKFDKREFTKKNKTFTFNNQVYDNIFWSIFSGVTTWTMYESFYFWGVSNNYLITVSFSDHPYQFFIWILILPFIRGVHFYFIHRLLHVPFLFKHVHKLHHRNINVGPWSGISMHPIENLIYQSSPLIHFVIPSDPMIFVFHITYVCLNPAFTHAGFEKLVKDKSKILDAGDFHHQLHHRYYDCNYGNTDVPLDEWFGTFHDGTLESDKKMKERRRKLS